MRDEIQYVGGTGPDAIRGAAALIVAVAHCWQIFIYPLTGDTLPFRILGSLAAWSVATFFLLSGMLIATSINRRAATGDFQFRSYIAARVLRIYPPLLTAVAITIGAVLIIQAFRLYGAEGYQLPGDVAAARERADIWWPDILSTLLLTYNFLPPSLFPAWLPINSYLFFNGPLWSLSYEFWMYVLAGVAAAAVISRKWIAAPIAILLIWRILIAPPGTTQFWVVAAVWLAGFAAGWAWPLIERISSRWILVGAAAFLVASLTIAGTDWAAFAVSPYGGTAQNCFYLGASGLLLCATIVSVRMRRGSPAGLFARAGAFSYTLYLVHFPLMLLALSIFRPMILQLGMIGHVALAIASFCAVVVISERLARVVENRRMLRSIVRNILGHRSRASA